ncbi:hypothetical protein JRI60_00265 [Archangium violaceum]|uniref:hypothetical protein n=1 Tax=Archangium violaceum TaxID=83451 RepID=UPI00194E1605|nr:hypothetical protein [Archangium violaceum]QRN97565.1 hypothetical protein JRI60_00265 [Archangium violaceum]
MPTLLRRSASFPLLALLLLTPPTVHAQGSSEVQDYLVSVNRLYEDLEYERALEQIHRARRLARGVEEDVALGLYEGILLDELGKQDDATAAFKTALFLRPEAKLPVQVSPKVEQHFESVRAGVKRELAPILARREAERRQAQPAPPRDVRPPGTGEVSATHGDTRSRALLPGIAGGVLLAAGGVSYGLSRVELSRLRTDDAGLVTRADAHDSASRGKTYQAVGLGLLGAGVVGLGAATGLYLLGSPTEPVALGVSTDGTSAFVYGRWP